MMDNVLLEGGWKRRAPASAGAAWASRPRAAALLCWGGVVGAGEPHGCLLGPREFGACRESLGALL